MTVTDEELKQELAKRKLLKQQQLLDEHQESTVRLVTGAVGPTLRLDVCIEGLPVSAVADTGAQSSITSRQILHKIHKHMQNQGKPMPRLELP